MQHATHRVMRAMCHTQGVRRLAELASMASRPGEAGGPAQPAAVLVCALLRTALPLVGGPCVAPAAGGSSSAGCGLSRAAAAAGGLWGLLRVAAAEMTRVPMALEEVCVCVCESVFVCLSVCLSLLLVLQGGCAMLAHAFP